MIWSGGNVCLVLRKKVNEEPTFVAWKKDGITVYVSKKTSLKEMAAEIE
jgi:hypothetical protein